MSQDRNASFLEKPPLQITKIKTSNSEQKIIQLPRINQTQQQNICQNSVYFNYYIVEKRKQIPIQDKSKFLIEKEKRKEKIQEFLHLPRKSLSQRRFHTETTQKKKPIDFTIHPYFSIQMPLSTKSIKSKIKEKEQKQGNHFVYPSPVHTPDLKDKFRVYREAKKIIEPVKPKPPKRQSEQHSECDFWQNSNTFNEEDSFTDYVQKIF